MHVPGAPEATATTLAAFAGVNVLLMYCLVKGRLPDLKRMVVRLVFTVLVICLCSLLVRANADRADSCLPGVGDSRGRHADSFECRKANAQRPKLLLPEFLGATFHNPLPALTN